MVAKNAMMTLFFTAPCQLRLVKKSVYQRSEYPAGSRESISGVNVKYGTELNERGTMTTSGAMRKKKMRPQMIRNV